MACYSPLQAYTPGVNRKTGKKVIKFERQNPSDVKLSLPCGKCIGCRLEKSRQWAIRGMCELITTQQKGYESCFLTLTYNDTHYPPHGNLVKKDIQDFVKRLRSRHPEIGHKDENGKHKSDIRVFYSGEYTPTSLRPHWHMIIYGYNFPDKVLREVTPTGNLLYTSNELEYGKKGTQPLWWQGFHRIGAVTYETVRYVAKYITKKVDGDEANKIMDGDFLRAYERLDPSTGEVATVSKELCETPRRPGLGSEFIHKYHKEVYPSDTIAINGKGTQRTCEYFDRQMEKIDYDILKKVVEKRRNYVRSKPEEITKTRMAEKEKHTLNRLKKLDKLRYKGIS